jgi:hypothetical protein
LAGLLLHCVAKKATHHALFGTIDALTPAYIGMLK